jgi:hypothetical protein
MGKTSTNGPGNIWPHLRIRGHTRSHHLQRHDHSTAAGSLVQRRSDEYLGLFLWGYKGNHEAYFIDLKRVKGQNSTNIYIFTLG